jgi:hypothetical protein
MGNQDLDICADPNSIPLGKIRNLNALSPNILFQVPSLQTQLI